MYYPVFLDLRGKRVLMVGAGRVALRKVLGLVEAGALVTVISPSREPGFEELDISYEARVFLPDDITGDYSLVFAATDDREVNRQVGEVAMLHGIPANIADAPDECAFILPARIMHGDLQVAVSTSGQDPRLAAHLRDRIQALLSEYRDS